MCFGPAPKPEPLNVGVGFEVLGVEVVFDFFGEEGASSPDFLLGLDIMNANAFLVAGADMMDYLRVGRRRKRRETRRHFESLLLTLSKTAASDSHWTTDY